MAIILKRLSTIIIVFIPCLGYVCGYSFYKGYLSGYGLNISNFPLSIYDIYYYAYFGTLILIKKNIWNILFYIYFYIYVGILLYTLGIKSYLQEIILTHLNLFNIESIKFLLTKNEDNSQTYERGRTYKDYIKIKERIDELVQNFNIDEFRDFAKKIKSQEE